MNKIILIIGLLCGGASGYLVWQTMQQAEARMASISYLSFSSNSGNEVLFAGDEISQSDIGTIELPNGADVFAVGDSLIEDTSANRSWLVGKTLNATIPRGRVLTFDLFEQLGADRLDQVIAPGMRAVSLSVNSEASLSNRVVPGNRIDIMGTWKDEWPPVSEIVLEDVKVIAVGDLFSYEEYRSDGERSYSTITIEVPAEDGILLSEASRRLDGNFWVMLRNQCDTAAPSAVCGD